MNRNKPMFGRLTRRTWCGALLFALMYAMHPLPSWTQATFSKYSLLKSAADSISAGDLAKAEAELQIVLKADPIDFQALDLLGVVRAQQQRTGEAEKLFQQSIQQKPLFAGAHVNLAFLYAQTHREEEAVAQYQDALRIDPKRSDALSGLLNVWRAQARAAVQTGELEKSLSLLLKARKMSPQDPDVLYDFGMIALRMSLFPDAIEALQQELAVKKDDPDALYALGRAQISLAKYPDAKSSFERFVQLRPTDASGHYALGLALQALQQMPEAREQFEKSTQLQPLQTEAYFQLGLMDLEDKNLDSASEHFSRVLLRVAKHAGALYGMGRVNFDKKDYSKAVTFLEQATAANTSLREPHYYLGLTYARLNRKSDSEKELQLASQIEHEELEKHQHVLKILDPGDSTAMDSNAAPNHP